MFRRVLAPLLGLVFPVLAVAQPIDFKVTYPEQFPEVPWLATHQRASFAIDDIARAINEDGVNVVIGGTNAGGPNGLVGGYWVLNEAKDGFVAVLSGEPMAPENMERMKENVRVAHANGAKVLSEVIRMNMTPWMQAKHPEYQEVHSPFQQPLKPEELAGTQTMGCWNSPYGDFFIESQVAMLKTFDFDGYNLDGFGCWTKCFCPACQTGYREETGREIPLNTDVNDSEFRHYLKWRLWRFTNFVQRWTAALKAVKPDFVAAPWSTGPGRWWHWMGAPFAEGSDAMHRVLDAPMVELLWDFPADQGSNLLPAFTVRYYRGLTGDRPAWFLPYFCEQGQFNVQAPTAECDLRNMTILTNGGLSAQGSWQQTPEAPLKHYLDEIKAREAYTGNARSLKWAAMFVGESGRLLYGLPGKSSEMPVGGWMGSGVDSPDMGNVPPGERRMPAQMESAVGVFRALMEDHLPLDIITEPDLDNYATLKQYKVLILPNSACLSDKMNANVRRFVQEGGGLVAMHEASIANEFGDQRRDFGLSDVFGVHFQGTSDHSARWPHYPNWVQLALDLRNPEHPILDDPAIRSASRGGDRTEYIGWMTNVKLATGTLQLGRRLSPKVEWPFIAINEANPGRSLYFAADIGQAYFIAPYHYQGKLIANAVRWAAQDAPPPIAVEAPMCIQAAFYTQNEGQRHVVHLLNELNSTANRALPENNVSMRMEVVPVHDVKVVAKGFTPSKALLVPGETPLTITQTPEGAEVTVPKVETHAMVVFE